MSNLSTFTKTPSFQFDWTKIEDTNDRASAKSAVDNYQKKFNDLRDRADALIKEDNLAKAQCVYTLKESLDHGQFLAVCAEALNMNKDTAAALASTGRLLMEGDHTEEILSMVQVMEPRAATRLLKADDETKSINVAMFEETGKVPSLRTFTTPKTPKKNKMYENESPRVSPTSSDAEAGQRLQSAAIRPAHFVGWLAEQLSKKDDVSPEMRGSLSDLLFQIKRLEIS